MRGPGFSVKRLFTAQLFCVLLLTGCDLGVAVHDQYRAGELVIDFLSAFRTEEGRKLAYEWTDDRYKQEVSFSEFKRIVFFIRDKNNRADIRLVGYEVFGPKEVINIYANSESDENKMYFKFTLVGTKSRDYYLIDMNINESEQEKKGIYREYGESIIIRGV